MTSISNGESGASVRAKLNTLFTDFANSEAKEVADLATLLADTSLTYTAGQDGTVVAGDIIRTRDGGVLQVAASAAVGVHAQTSNAVPVKLIDLYFAKDARAHTSRLVERLENNDGNCAIVVFSDSTGNETSEWVYLLAGYIAEKYPAFSVNYRLWDDGAGTYAAATSIQTGTGSNTLTIWNAALAGSKADDWIGARYTNAFSGTDPDVVFVSFGHNGSSDVSKQINSIVPLLSKIVLQAPDIPIVLIGQNPTTTGDTMAPKVEAFRALAARFGLGFINVHAAFRQSPTALSSLMADTVHPNADGQQLWAKTVFTAFSGTGSSVSGPGPSPEVCVLKSVSQFSEFSQWVVSGAGASVSKDVTDFETSGHSTKITNTAGEDGAIFAALIDSKDVKALRGEWVTFAARIKFTSGDATTGRVAVFDGTTSVTTDTGGPGTGDFYWQIVSMQVGAAATYVRGYVYASTSEDAGVVSVDRAILLKGKWFEDDVKAATPEYIEGLRLFGSRSDGLLVLRNDLSGSLGIVGLSTNSGADDDNAATEYTFYIGGDLWGMKARGDTQDRIRITPSTGEILFGDGSSAPTQGIRNFGSGRLRIGNTSIEPSADNSFDCGISGRAWRRGFFGTAVNVAGNNVLGAQQTAIADSVGGDEQAKINAILAAMRAHGLIAT